MKRRTVKWLLLGLPLFILIIACGGWIPLLIAAIFVKDIISYTHSGFVDKDGHFAFHLRTIGEFDYFKDGVFWSYDNCLDRRGKTLFQGTDSRSDDFYEGLAAVRSSEKWGFVDKIGRFVVLPCYENVGKFSEGLAPAKLHGKWGFIDKTGNDVIPGRYDGALPFSDGLAAVSKDGKVGFIDHSGREVISFVFTSANSFAEERAIVLSGQNKHWICIDKTGKVIFDVTALGQKFSTSKKVDPDGYVCSAKALRAQDRDLWLLHDKIGMSCPNEFHEGRLVFWSGGKYGYLDRSGSIAIACQFADAQPFSGGLAVVHSQIFNYLPNSPDSKCGYIDINGTVKIPLEFEYAHDFREGLASVQDKDGFKFIDKTGQTKFRVSGEWAGDFHDGLAAVGDLDSSL